MKRLGCPSATAFLYGLPISGGEVNRLKTGEPLDYLCSPSRGTRVMRSLMTPRYFSAAAGHDSGVRGIFLELEMQREKFRLRDPANYHPNSSRRRLGSCGCMVLPMTRPLYHIAIYVRLHLENMYIFWFAGTHTIKVSSRSPLSGSFIPRIPKTWPQVSKRPCYTLSRVPALYVLSIRSTISTGLPSTAALRRCLLP